MNLIQRPSLRPPLLSSSLLKGLLVLLLGLTWLWVPTTSWAQTDYYFPEGTQFDTEISSPSEFLGYEIGDHLTRHDRIVAYFRELARQSDRATYQEIGQSIEHRPMPLLTVTAPENHEELETIRRQHLEALDPEESSGSAEERPVIVHLGYGVHGDEISSSEAALLTAYWLVAGQGSDVSRYLQQGVYHIEPVLNPDGRDRHTTWANMHKGDPLVADPLDREHNEVWPEGRTNHYWFDLNRDWLPLEQPESRARIDFHHRWRPNVVTDYHEMGTNSTYFFEPTEPELSWNPLLPERLYTELTPEFADFYADALDEIGSLYWTKEDIFDNSHPGYGSTYPNFLGGLGLVFEQASSRGIVQESTRHGELTLSYAIRNHLRTSIGTVQAAVERRSLLLNYQRDFFASVPEKAEEFEVDAYVFGDPNDDSRNRAFLDLLLQHRIDVYKLSETREIGGHTFNEGSAWVVPTNQPNYHLVRSIFERTDKYTGRAGSRASAWTMSLAYGIPDAEIRDGDFSQGAQVTEVSSPEGLGEVPQSSYAYLLDWSEYAAPRALYHLQKNDILTNVAFKPFAAQTNEGEVEYPRGTISIPVQPQDVDPSTLHGLIQEAEKKAGVQIQSTETGFTPQGIDLGSGNFRAIDTPKALMLVGEGTSGYEAGEVWHLLDTRVDMPITKVDRNDLSGVHWGDYDVVVLVSGEYEFLEEELDDVRRWVENGGTLVALRTAAQWAVENDLAPRVPVEEADEGDEQVDAEDEEERRDYAEASVLQPRQEIDGTIVEVDLDTTHPLGFGYHRRSLPVWRNHNIFIPPSENPYSTVAQYTDDPRLSGFLTEENVDKLQGTASVLADELGEGSVVLFLDNPNFRGFWYGTNKLFLNALFFGDLIEVP